MSKRKQEAYSKRDRESMRARAQEAYSKRDRERDIKKETEMERA